MKGLWTWAFGTIEEAEAPLRDIWLLRAVGAIVCLALLGGFELRLPGAPLLRGAWRSGMYGGAPLAVLVAWWQWRHGSGLAPRLLTAVGATLVVLPWVTITQGDGAIRALIDVGAAATSGVILGYIALFAAARQASMAPGAFGLGLGDWRWWLPRTALGMALCWIGATAVMLAFPDMARFYPPVHMARTSLSGLAAHCLGLVFDIFGWEMMFRGVLLWVFARRGDVRGAIEAQAIVFFCGHLDKPVTEMLLSLPGGVIAGMFAWRSGSFLPIWLMHSTQLVAVNVVGFWLHQAY